MTEFDYWRNLINELQMRGASLERIAEAVGVSTRQVSYWKNGQRPSGLHAVNLVMFHGKQKIAT